MATGVFKHHSRSCRVKRDGKGARCTCNGKASYEAWVYHSREKRRESRRFRTEAEAIEWRTSAFAQIKSGRRRAPTTTTVREEWDAWLEGANASTIRNGDGSVFKPSTIRSYARSMRLHVLDDLGAHKLSAVTHVDLQDFVDGLLAGGRDASTIRNTIMPLRAIYGRAVGRDKVAVNPTKGLRLPSVTGRRDRIAPREEAARLIAAVPEGDRAVWATAFYAGLRRGELRALRWEDVDDLRSGQPFIHVERAMDDTGVTIEPKSRAGRRNVPVVAALRTHLTEHRLRTGRVHGLVFGRGPTDPFSPPLVRRRALKAWEAAELEPIALHECRHTCASLLIAAGVNIKTISTYMGHASVAFTLDRYGHLLPGHAAEAVGLMDQYLAAQ